MRSNAEAYGSQWDDQFNIRDIFRYSIEGCSSNRAIGDKVRILRGRKAKDINVMAKSIRSKGSIGPNQFEQAITEPVNMRRMD